MIWFRLAFVTASRTASGFSSTLMTSLASRDAMRPMVPIPAVGVHDAFVSGEAGQGDGFFVQIFRLNRVDLVEGLRGDAEGAAAEFILDVTASEEDNVAFSEYHAVGAVVDVQYDRGDLRVEFAQGLYEVVFDGKTGDTQTRTTMISPEAKPVRTMTWRRRP